MLILTLVPLKEREKCGCRQVQDISTLKEREKCGCRQVEGTSTSRTGGGEDLY